MSARSLPQPPTAFVGRALDLVRLGSLVSGSDDRLITLVGTAGVGKTRLAIEAALRAVDLFPDGVAFVGLADVREPEMFDSAVASVLGTVDAGQRSPYDLVLERVRDRRLLLVLDNLEHLLEVGARIVELLSENPLLAVLATSRRPLEVRGETVYRVEPLSLPVATAADAEGALGSDAVAFFLARLRAADSGFSPTAADVVLVARVCARLDGLPLALEIVAARARSLGLAGLLDALNRHLPVLGEGPRDLPERQRTMASALEWSRGLLSPAAATSLSRLAVAVGGVDLAAARALAGEPGDEVGALEVLDELVRHSLLTRVETDASTRYRMLEVVREFALAQFSSEELDEARRRHADHFLDVARSAARGFDGPQQAALLDQLGRDSANFAAAVGYAVDRSDAASALRLCLSLRFYWYVRGSLSDGRALFARALAIPEVEPLLRARGLVECAALARHQGSYDESAGMLSEALRLIGDQHEGIRAGALLQQGFVAHLRDDYQLAQASLEECLAIREAASDQLGVARALLHLGFVARGADDDVPRAWELQSRALAIFRELKNVRHVATALIPMADLARARGDLPAARRLMNEALSCLGDLADTPLLAHALYVAAGLAADDGQFNRAVRLVGAAEALASADRAAPWPSVERSAQRWLPLAVGALGRPRMDALRAGGAAMGFADAIALAGSDADAARGPLTAREWEVAELVAAGLSNRAIAEKLVLSTRTIDGHVSRILTKLDLRSRAQIATWVTTTSGDAGVRVG